MRKMSIVPAHLLMVFLWLFLCITLPRGHCAQRNIQVPSVGAGSGNLAVRISYPDSQSEYRFDEGCPVLVFSPGGHEPGSLDSGGPWTDFGFTVITFLYPGGTQGAYSSDGTYDYRGENCIQALTDVIRYAMGFHQDIMGNTIDDLFPGTVLTDNVGIVASSNGGPTATAALNLHSSLLQGVKYIVHMESPTSDQTVNGDLGNVGLDCDLTGDGDGNGLPRDDGKNSHYTGYGISSCTVDYSNLTWSSTELKSYNDPAGTYPSVQIPGMVFLDNNGNGTVDYVDTPPCFDIDGNGQLDSDEDYPFSGKITFSGPGDVKVYLSTEVTAAADSMSIFGGPWPSHIADVVESDLFWSWRDATLHFSAVSSSFPDLGVLLVFTESDHVQAADDHPHIQQTYDAYQNGSIWCRLNPDLAYIEYASGSSAPVGTQDNDANMSVLHGDMKFYSNPESVNGLIAGACEMSDRIQFGKWETNLDEVITGPTPKPSPTWTPVPYDWPPLYIVSMMHAEESQPFHQNQAMFEDHATSLRALSGLFASHGAKLDFGPDWTFIEGVKQFEPDLLADLLTAGHGIHTHAHESQFDLSQVNGKLLEAGLTENHVANGGFLNSGTGGTNWVGYISDFQDSNQDQLFQVAVGYKNPNTQEIVGIGHAFRPAAVGDWTVHDPSGSLIYLGCNMPEEEGGALDFETIQPWMEDVLTRIDPNKMNTLYWHDSLHKYGDQTMAQARMNEWEQLLTGYFDHLVTEGRIEWRNFSEMGQIYQQWEQTYCGDTGVCIQMSSNILQPGDPCWCKALVCNAGVTPMDDYPLFVILDIYGSLYFAPSFESFDSYLQQYPQFAPGRTDIDVLPPFTWPEGVGSATGIQWIAALTDPGITQIVGEWDMVTFGWSE